MTDRLQAGENVIACVLADGWYRGSVGAFNNCNVFGRKTKFACTIRLEYADGRAEYIYTGEDWKATQEGPLRENDLKLTEIYDATKEMAGWNRRGFDDSTWHGCILADYAGNIIPSRGGREFLRMKLLHRWYYIRQTARPCWISDRIWRGMCDLR